MMPKSGFVLLTIVVMLSVITGLILTQNKMTQLALRRQSLYASYQARETQLEAVAARLLINVISAKAQIHAQSLHYARLSIDPELRGDDAVSDDTLLQKQLLHQGHDYSDHYRYLINDLGDYPCMKLSGSHASHHWLLSLMDTQIPTRLLQLRIASPIADLPCIHQPVSYHSIGLLSWRSLVIRAQLSH